MGNSAPVTQVAIKNGLKPTSQTDAIERNMVIWGASIASADLIHGVGESTGRMWLCIQSSSRLLSACAFKPGMIGSPIMTLMTPGPRMRDPFGQTVPALCETGTTGTLD